MEIEAVAEGLTGDMLHDTADNFVVCSQQVHEIEQPTHESLFVYHMLLLYTVY